MSNYVLPQLPEYQQIVRSVMRADALLTGHRRILELMAQRAPLFNVLHELVSFLESQYDGLLCSILIIDHDTQTFKVGVEACESKNYSLEASGVTILPPYGGPCCMSSHTGERVVSEHIASDDRWLDSWKAWAVGQGLRSCRSQPIVSSTGKVLGAFAMYHKESSDPAAENFYQLELATLVAGIAIERKQIEWWLSIVTIHGSGDTGAVPHVGMKHTLSFGNGALMSKSLHSPSKKNRKAKTNRKSALVVTVDEIRDLLGIGRAGAYALAKRLGRRVSGKKRGRLLVLRTALDEWLRGQAAGGAS